MVKRVDTHFSILSIWSTIPPLKWVSKILNRSFMIYSLWVNSLLTLFTCKITKKIYIVSTLWLPLNCLCLFMSWIWSFVPLFLIFFILFPISNQFLHSESVSCFWSMKCTYLHMITRILQFPFTPLLIVFPFAIYNHSTLFSKWMNEWSERM